MQVNSLRLKSSVYIYIPSKWASKHLWRYHLFCCWWYKHECRYFVVQRVHIFVPGQKKFLRSPICSVRYLSFLILDEDFSESSLTSIISCNWFKIMMSHSFFKRHILLHIIRFKGVQNFPKLNSDHTFHYVANFWSVCWQNRVLKVKVLLGYILN